MTILARPGPPAALAVALALAAACGAQPPVRPGAVAPRSDPPAAPADPSLHERLGEPRPGDWRSSYPDDGCMTPAEYVRTNPVRADGERTTLCFVPAGPFSAEQRGVLDDAVAFSALWFDLPVRTLDGIEITAGPSHRRARGGADQVSTRWFLERKLPSMRPADSVCLLAVTMTDLYPEDSWNFVFGEADLRRRIGVWSLARYFPEWSGESRTPESDRLALLRALKVVVHEAGHTFGLEHCTTWLCAMNGSNSLRETDAQPLRLCPDCETKLAWNREWDGRALSARAGRIAGFLESRGLAAEAAWHRRRAGR